MDEVGDIVRIFTAEIHNCPYCGLEVMAPRDINEKDVAGDSGYGAYSLVDQEKWNGGAR